MGHESVHRDGLADFLEIAAVPVLVQIGPVYQMTDTIGHD